MLSVELHNGTWTKDSLKPILSDFHKEGPVNPNHLETLALMKSSNPDAFHPFESNLMHVMGLFYKTTEPQTFIELVYSIYGESIKDDTGRAFTPMQADVYKSIQGVSNFSFSAPTSTGKSYVFQELIRDTEGDVIIVVPSRALLAEYIIKIRTLVPKEILVLPFIELVNTKKTTRRIYIITPERGDDLFKRMNDLNIKLVLFDEAQLTEQGVRGMKFDSFVRRVDKKIPGAKKIFAHPFVNNPEAQLNKHGLLNENSAYQLYTQNNVGKIHLTHKNGVFKHFSPYEDNTQGIVYDGDIVEHILRDNGTCLIYISKRKIYDASFLEEFSKYLGLCPEVKEERAKELISQLEEYFGTDNDRKSLIIFLMKRGIVIHHGSMPLKARTIIEKFVNEKFAKLCFSTSTLIQGINMPFDLVWIHNFRFDGNDNGKILDLKNLIGRAGRTTSLENSFDYGYVVIEEKNKRLFVERLTGVACLSDSSLLDENSDNFDEDFRDVVEAIQNDTFNEELNLTETQVERLSSDQLNLDILYVLDNLMDGDRPLTGMAYYMLPENVRKTIKTAFHNIYASHLRRNTLELGEEKVLDTSIPIFLWQIQGKSFAETVALRYSFLSERNRRNRLRRQLVNQEISVGDYERELQRIPIRFSCMAESLPNRKFTRPLPLFHYDQYKSVKDIDFDIVMYDTYDYIDKVISLSLKDPISAAFHLYHKKSGDARALALSNYISYNTNDPMEIWLLKYGFTFDEIVEIMPHIDNVDESEIIFKNSINEAIQGEHTRELIERYI
jgi:hypothetical protein